MSRLLETKRDIATSINRHDLPVIRVDLADTDEYGLNGGKVLVDAGTFPDGFPFLIQAEFRAYRDEKRFTVSSHGACLTNSFSYYDMEDLLAYANAPIIRPNSEVIVCVVDSIERKAFKPVVLRTGNVTKHCSTPISFEDADASMYVWMGMKYAEK